MIRGGASTRAPVSSAQVRRFPMTDRTKARKRAASVDLRLL